MYKLSNMINFKKLINIENELDLPTFIMVELKRLYLNFLII